MIILPAIDLRNGKCVRLVEGLLEKETIYSDDPAAMALKWQEAGAKILHLVDLDGAFAGEPKNLKAVKQIVDVLHIPAQLGGGIRNLDTIKLLLDDIGLQRVILGTAAVNNPELVEEACLLYGDRIVLGVDAKDGYVAVQGWGETVQKKAVDLALEMKELGIHRVIFTDIRRDGTMQGPNVESTKELAQKTGLKVIASGGISSIEDIKALKAVEAFGVDSAITGKAIYTGSINLAEAIKVAEGAI